MRPSAVEIRDKKFLMLCRLIGPKPSISQCRASPFPGSEPSGPVEHYDGRSGKQSCSSTCSTRVEILTLPFILPFTRFGLHAFRSFWKQSHLFDGRASISGNLFPARRRSESSYLAPVQHGRNPLRNLALQTYFTKSHQYLGARTEGTALRPRRLQAGIPSPMA